MLYNEQSKKQKSLKLNKIDSKNPSATAHCLEPNSCLLTTRIQNYIYTTNNDVSNEITCI